MKYRVLIPTSGIGSRLGDITKYTNKALVRIENKPSISYIIERYPEDCEFVITLGYFGDHIKQFLNITYPNRKFIFVDVFPFQGPGSSLGYSMLKAKNHLQVPFIYNACDTITLDKALPPTTDYICGFKVDDLNQYDSYNVNELENVTKTFEKGEIGSDYAYVGLIGIKNYKDFWSNLNNLYLDNPNNSKLSDFWCIDSLLKENKKIKHILLNTWFDIGNAQALQSARKAFSTDLTVLDKAKESIFIYDKFVVKFFSEKNSVKNRVSRASILKNVTPKILDYTDNFYKYEFVNGDLMSSNINDVNVLKLLNWSKANLWSKLNIDKVNFKTLCKNFYIDKTLSRASDFLQEKSDSQETINEIKVPAFKDLINSIDIKKICDGMPSKFHGDYILDNILKTKNSFVLLDWRQDFAGNLEVGDMYYDLAKLNHSFIVNHKVVNDNLYTINKTNNKIVVDIYRKQSVVNAHDTFKKWVIENNFDINKINILTSLIWINMSPLHHKPFNEFLFYFGKLHLFKYINYNEYSRSYNKH